MISYHIISCLPAMTLSQLFRFWCFSSCDDLIQISMILKCPISGVLASSDSDDERWRYFLL